jgi:hypothetical protein
MTAAFRGALRWAQRPLLSTSKYVALVSLLILGVLLCKMGMVTVASLIKLKTESDNLC